MYHKANTNDHINFQHLPALALFCAFVLQFPPSTHVRGSRESKQGAEARSRFVWPIAAFWETLRGREPHSSGSLLATVA